MIQKTQQTRVNFQIRAYTVRVTKDGQQLGVMPIEKARNLAQDDGLDLVEVAPTANPPVCAIMDYGRFKYEQNIKDKENRRHQRESMVETKELRLSPRIDEHDVDIKTAMARKFLSEGKKVQFNLKYKNRELSHKEIGFSLVNKIIANISDIANVEMQPKMEGTRLVCRLMPKP